MTVRPDHLVEDAVAIFRSVGGPEWAHNAWLGAVTVLGFIVVVSLLVAVMAARR